MLCCPQLLKILNSTWTKPYIKVAWNEKEGILINHFKGFATHDEIVQIGTRIIEAVVIEKATKILYDARGLEILDDNSREYIIRDFARQVGDSGVLYAATVLPEDVFARSTMGQIEESLRYLNDVNRYFPSVVKALEWLRSM